MSFEHVLNEYVKSINDEIEERLPIIEGAGSIVSEAMRYSIIGGGKRLRPVILLASAAAFSDRYENALPFAAAVEMIHTYSLIHDDLPAMDNDDYRRGRLSCHKKYGEAYAILAGDGLLNLAYEVIFSAVGNRTDKTPDCVEAARIIAKAAGTNGMIAGQAADIYWEGKTPGEEALMYINLNKTAALLSAAFEAGSALGGANAEQRQGFANAGIKIGIAFQIKDDILDYEGDFKNLGKLTGSDVRNDKTTYITLFGIEKCKEKVEKLSEEACGLLESAGRNVDFLTQLTKNLVTRIK